MPESHVEDEHEHEGHIHDEHDDHGHDHDGHDHDHDGHDHDHSLITDQLPGGDWVVETGTSDISFRTRAMMGILPVSGVFDSFSGEFHVDDSGAVSGQLKIDTASIETGTEKRDDHLRSGEYFGSAEHPHITFTVESLTPSGEEHLNLEGSLQIRDTVIPLAFTLYAIAHGDHLHVEGRATIDHKAAGLNWARPGMISKKVKSQVALTLHRAAPGD